MFESGETGREPADRDACTRHGVDPSRDGLEDRRGTYEVRMEKFQTAADET